MRACVRAGVSVSAGVCVRVRVLFPRVPSFWAPIQRGVSKSSAAIDKEHWGWVPMGVDEESPGGVHREELPIWATLRAKENPSSYSGDTNGNGIRNRIWEIFAAEPLMTW